MSVKTARTSKELVEAARAYLSDTNTNGSANSNNSNNTNSSGSGNGGGFSTSKAGELLTSAVQQDPTFVNALVLRSNLAGRVGQLSAATADLSLAIEMDRGSGDARRIASLYGSRSSLFTRAGRSADAIADLRAALRCEPDNGVWAFELGRAFLREGRVSLAQLSFQQALQEPLWSHVNETTKPKVYALYGRSCLMSRDYRRAKALLRKSLEVGGEGAAVLHDVGLAHYHEGTSPESAIDFFARATEKDSQPVEYPMHLGLTHVRCGNLNDALSSLNEAVLRGQDDAILRFYRGCVELQLGLGPQALIDLAASAEPPTTTGEAVQRAKKKGDSVFCRTMTSPAPAWMAMALVHLFCEESLDDASACLAEALGSDIDTQQRILAGLLLGIVQLRQHHYFAALRALSEVLAVMRGLSADGVLHGTITTTTSSSSNSSGAATTSPPSKVSALTPAERRFFMDAELLALTYTGLAYSGCGYADVALRFFAHACRSAQRKGDVVQIASALHRQAVAEVQLGDGIGALETLRSCGPSSSSSNAVKALNAGRTPLSLTSSSATLAAEPQTPHTTHRPAAAVVPASSSPASASSTLAALPSLLLVHHHAPGEMAHLYAVTLRRLGRLSEALHFATEAIEVQQHAATGNADAAAARTATSASSPAPGAASLGSSRSVSDVPAYLYNRGLIHFSLRNYAEAMHDVETCLAASSERTAALHGSSGTTATAISTTADVFYLKGCIAHATGDFAEALTSLSTALRMEPALATSHVFSYSHGVLLAIAGRHDEAVDAFSAAIAHSDDGSAGKDSHRVAYYHERAKVFQQMGRYAEALADFNRVLPATTAAATTSAVNWNALVNRALTLKELQRYPEAAADWDAALRLDTSGCLAQLTSQDVFELPYMELCRPGCELHAAK